MGAPKVTPIAESRHDGGFIVSLANGHQSFETGTVAASAAAIAPGTVLGRLTSGGTLTPYTVAGSDGSQNIVGVMLAQTRVVAAIQSAVYIARGAEVNAGEIIWPAGISGPQTVAGTAALAALGILAR